MAWREQYTGSWTIEQCWFHSEEELWQTSVSIRVPLWSWQHWPSSAAGVPWTAVEEGKQKGCRGTCCSCSRLICRTLSTYVRTDCRRHCFVSYWCWFVSELVAIIMFLGHISVQDWEYLFVFLSFFVRWNSKPIIQFLGSLYQPRDKLIRFLCWSNSRYGFRTAFSLLNSFQVSTCGNIVKCYTSSNLVGKWLRRYKFMWWFDTGILSWLVSHSVHDLFVAECKLKLSLKPVTNGFFKNYYYYW